MSRPTERDKFYEEQLRSWIWTNRRDVILLGAGGLGYFVGLFNRAYADAEFQIEASPEESPKPNSGNSDVSQTHDTPAIVSAQENKEHTEKEVRTEDKLGGAYRPASCGLQNLSTSQFIATGTPRQPPNNASTTPGSFFSDGPSRKFLSGGEAPLSTALRSVGEKIPPGWTVSVGGESLGGLSAESMGVPGLTPVFLLAQADFSSQGIGLSETVGAGELAGVFVTRALLNGHTTWSVGAFRVYGKVTVMESLNVTEMYKGIVSIDIGLFAVDGLKNMEISREIRPVDLVMDTLNDFDGIVTNVLSPMSDPDSFRDPLLYW